jgi:hypothetical protein
VFSREGVVRPPSEPASHRISTIDALAWPIPFGNRWRDSGASNLWPPHTGFSVVTAREVEHRICLVGRYQQRFAQAFDGGFGASLLIQQIAKIVLSLGEVQIRPNASGCLFFYRLE